MNKELTPKLGTSVIMQHALDWWHELPIQDIYECKLGWVNLGMKYYPMKTEYYSLTGEEIQHIYEQEQNNIG